MRKLFGAFPVLLYSLATFASAVTFVYLIIASYFYITMRGDLAERRATITIYLIVQILLTVVCVLILILKITNLHTGAVLPGICCVIIDLVMLSALAWIASKTLQNWELILRNLEIIIPAAVLSCNLLCNLISLKGSDA